MVSDHTKVTKVGTALIDPWRPSCPLCDLIDLLLGTAKSGMIAASVRFRPAETLW
jgi:hypothetical protein